MLLDNNGFLRRKPAVSVDTAGSGTAYSSVTESAHGLSVGHSHGTSHERLCLQSASNMTVAAAVTADTAAETATAVPMPQCLQHFKGKSSFRQVPISDCPP